MKNTGFQTIFILVCFVLYCGAKDVCRNNNPYILLLKEANVLLLDTPKKVQACGNEWMSFGTCCDLNSLTLAVNTDVNQIKTQMSELVYNLENIETSFSKLKDGIKPRLDDRTDIAFQNMRPKIQALLNIKAVQISGVKAAVARCWNHMAKIRSSSVCTTCSGRSQIFFSGNKAMVSEDT